MKAIGKLVTELANYFGKELNDHALRFYIEGLRDIPLEKLEWAKRRAIQTLKKMPFVPDLSGLAYERTEEALYVHALPSRCEKCEPDGWVLVPNPSGTGNFAIRCNC